MHKGRDYPQCLGRWKSAQCNPIHCAPLFFELEQFWGDLVTYSRHVLVEFWSVNDDPARSDIVWTADFEDRGTMAHATATQSLGERGRNSIMRVRLEMFDGNLQWRSENLDDVLDWDGRWTAAGYTFIEENTTGQAIRALLPFFTVADWYTVPADLLPWE